MGQDLPAGFHQTALGPLPKEWEVASLGDLLQAGDLFVQNGFAQGQHNQTGEGVPHLRPFNVTANGRVDLSQVKYVVPPSEESSYWVQAGDIIFNNTNSEELVGKTAFFPFSGRFVLSNHMTILRVLSEGRLDGFWLSHELLFLWHQRLFQTLCRRHVNQASVSLARLQGVAIPLPPLPEQHAIAGVLRTVQQAIAATEQVIAAARELKRSLMRHLFTYGPVAVGQIGQVPLRENEFGVLPESWPVARLDECAFVQTGAAKGRRFGDSKTVDVPYLRVANVQDGFLDLSEIKHIRIQESEVARYSLQPGDVVVTEGGDFDKLGRGFIWQGEIAHCVHQNHIFAIRTRRQTLLPEYLAYLIQSDYGKAYFLTVAHRTTHLACINATKLKAFPTLLPSLDEQREIVHLLASVDRKIGAEESRRASLEDVFNTLLHHLMTGRVRVSKECRSQ